MMPKKLRVESRGMATTPNIHIPLPTHTHTTFEFSDMMDCFETKSREMSNDKKFHVLLEVNHINIDELPSPNRNGRVSLHI